MTHYVVRVSYDWVLPVYRDVEVDANTAGDAVREALNQADRDPDFWSDAIECDGEAGPTTAETIDPENC